MSFLKPRKDDHPKVHEAYEVMKDGRMDRREFVRVAALVGVSASAAYAMAGIPSPAWALENSPFPADDPKAKKGGKLRVGMAIQKMEDSATFSWAEMSKSGAPHRRIPVDDRAGQHHPADAGGKLDAVERPEGPGPSSCARA